MNKKYSLVIGILLILFLITACSKESTVQIQETQQETQTQETSQTQTGIKNGDLVEMNFVLYGEDGRIIDTNDKQKAEEAELETYSTGIYRFLVGKSGKVNGFDEAIIRLEKGDKKTRNIPASKDKLEITFDIESVQSRIKTIPRQQTFSLKTFEKTFGKKPIINDIIVNRDIFPWPYKILAITNNSALGEIVIKQGDKVEIPGTKWKSQATIVSERAIQFLQMPLEGQIIDTEFGKAEIEVARSQMKIVHKPEMGKEFFYTLPSEQLISPRYEFKVSEITEEDFTITRINYPEQENLKLEVEIIEVTPGDDFKRIK